MAPPPQIDADFLAFQQAVAGQFSIERELGRGGMGVVYLAREVQLERQVAIKVLPPALAARSDLRERFLREARTAAKLSHPNIVPIFRVDEAGAFVYFVMAFVDGETLTDRVRGRGPLPPAQVTRLVQEVAWALAYAHARGVVHRDVKPDNIMLERGANRALVTDFGIAHLTGASGLTEVGQVVGTAHYMSPEQASGEAVDGRSDLYSLGVVAHFAVTGKLPFDAPTVQAILAKHLTQPPPPVATVNAGVPRALAQAIDRVLAKDPADRFATGEAMAEAVAAAPATVELPMPLRMWTTRRVPLHTAYLATSAFFGVVTVVAVVVPLIYPKGHSNGVGMAVLMTLAPLVPPALFRLLQTRSALAAGYGLEDLRLALAQHTQRLREEQEYDATQKPALIGRIFRGVSLLALGTAVVGIGLATFGSAFISKKLAAALIGGSFTVATVSGLLGLSFPGRWLTRSRAPGSWRLRFWNSKAGALATKFASLGLGKRATATTMQRPTELAIGLAAADLYASLPKAQQQELSELPEVVKRLEAEAQTFRKRVAELDEQLAKVGADDRTATLAGVADQRARVAADLRAAREGAGRRLATTVAALETIRLDLLRLHAGAGDTRQITGVLQAASRIGEQIDETVQARAEVEAIGSGE